MSQAVAGASTFSQPRLPLEFEPNLGQAAPDVRHVGRGDGAILRFYADRVVMGAPGGVVELRFVGAGQYPELRASGPTGGRSNYFVGDDPEAWRTEVPRYSTLRYSGIYPGIDVVFRDNGESLEYDFVVSPTRWACPSRSTAIRAFQSTLAGLQDAMVVKLSRRGAIVWSTYLGGSDMELSTRLALDRDGVVHVGGLTLSSDFPVERALGSIMSGQTDGFVAKLFDPLEFFIGSVLGDRPVWSGAPALVESGAPAVVESGAPAVGRTAGDVPRQLRSG